MSNHCGFSMYLSILEKRGEGLKIRGGVSLAGLPKRQVGLSVGD